MYEVDVRPFTNSLGFRMLELALYRDGVQVHRELGWSDDESGRRACNLTAQSLVRHVERGGTPNGYFLISYA